MAISSVLIDKAVQTTKDINQLDAYAIQGEKTGAKTNKPSVCTGHAILRRQSTEMI